VRAQYCDLAHDAQLALTVWRIREGQPDKPLGGATLRLFSKKGRLKSGRQELRLWVGREADVAWPPATPAKPPVSQRGELGWDLSPSARPFSLLVCQLCESGRFSLRRRLEQLLKRYERGEVAPVEWLDHLTLQRIEQFRAQVIGEPECSSETAIEMGCWILHTS
jgi:phosphatidylinositol 3-kinase